MTARRSGQQIPHEKWPELLTDDLKKHFDKMGEEIVRHDVTKHRYRKPEKHYAALQWLKLKHEKKNSKDNWLFRIAILTLVVAIVGAVAALF